MERATKYDTSHEDFPRLTKMFEIPYCELLNQLGVPNYGIYSKQFTSINGWV